MRHEVIQLPETGVELETYLTDNRAVEAGRRKPLMLVFPGGAYAYRSDREAEPVALRLTSLGIQAVIVRYSVAPARYPKALEEAAEAVAYAHAHAEEWLCDPKMVAVMGFSAGGHAAAHIGLKWHQMPQGAACRPDAMILGYPVITSGRFAHRGSFDNLLGESATEVQLERLSLENTVNENTPATFIWHTQADDAVPVENSLLFVNALQEAHIKTEFHLFPNGPHGLSLADNTTSVSACLIDPNVAVWIDMAVRFVKNL